MNDYQRMIALSRYARWIESEGRRETWEETVNRYFDFMESHLRKKCNYELETDLRNKLQKAVTNLEIMPSMRALMTAGPALDRCNVCAYNCSYLPVDHPRAFDEALYILMCGTGLGFSVERQEIAKLPEVSEHFEKSSTTIIVQDSKAGWARGLKELIQLLYSGQIPSWDLSKLRPAGARLKTFGGRSSGPEPLNGLFNFVVKIFKSAAGRKLTSLECHDIMCKIGDVVVTGGVRRSALISLSNLSDERMRNAKSGNWYETEGQRQLANNSVAYTEKPELLTFFKEWQSLYKSMSGERGIFNRQAAKKKCQEIGRDADHNFGANPCGEIILRPYQFCNLSEVVVRNNDTPESLFYKTELAAILGTFQSTLTDFKYLRSVWKKNVEEERLLGVSLTGIIDNINLTTNKNLLTELRSIVQEVNHYYAEQLGVQASAARTCVKPSGTVSQLVLAGSGIHTWHAPYYIRRIRGSAKDPLTKLMMAEGIPYDYAVGKTDTVVFDFPIKAPEGSITRKNQTALEALNIWLTLRENWCDHNPSVTISIRDSEWFAVADWVWNNFDKCAGVSFIPYNESDTIYKQAPYEEISEEEYYKLVNEFPNVNWSRLAEFEEEDATTGTQELSCTGGVCEINYIGEQ